MDAPIRRYSLNYLQSIKWETEWKYNKIALNNLRGSSSILIQVTRVYNLT